MANLLLLLSLMAFQNSGLPNPGTLRAISVDVLPGIMASIHEISAQYPSPLTLTLKLLHSMDVMEPQKQCSLKQGTGISQAAMRIQCITPSFKKPL